MSNSSFVRDDSLLPKGLKVPYIHIILSTLSVNLLSLALPIMTLQIYDRIIPGHGTGTLFVLTIGVMIALLMEAVLRLLRAWMLERTGAAYEHRVSVASMRHILQANTAYTVRAGIGEHLHRFAAIAKLKDFYNGYTIMTLAEMAFVPFYLAVITAITGPLVIVPACVLMLYTVVSLIEGQGIRASLHRRDKADDRRYNFLIEVLEGIHTIKTMALEKIFTRRYEPLHHSSTLANFNVTDAYAMTFNTGAIFSPLMIAAIIAVGGWFALHGLITTGALIATVLLAGRLMQPLQRALSLWAKYQDYTLASDKVRQIFDTPRHMIGDIKLEVEPVREGHLQLANVSYHAPDDTIPSLRNITIDLKRGDCLLIDGDNTEARTQLMELIAGMRPSNGGDIMVDGENLNRYRPEQLVQHVAYVPAEGVIFRGTIRDNLTCFGATPEENVRQIAMLLNLNRDIARLPSGYDTPLTGTNSDMIPPGLKQRIAIARILAPKPRIILFENADRALDRDGYRSMFDLLARLKGKVTMVLVTDDRNLRALADRVCLLENGTLGPAQPISDKNALTVNSMWS